MADESGYPLAVYLNLARASQRRQRILVRDRFLVLAGTEASQLLYFQLAQYCRAQILLHNPRHLIGRWATISEALLNQDFVTFHKRILRRYRLERAEQMLVKLGIDISNEQATYYDNVEYAASILGIDVREISDDDTAPGSGLSEPNSD